MDSVACGALCLLDRSTQQLLQSPAWQQSATLHAVARTFNWWGGPGVVLFAALLWLGGRALAQARLSEIGLRGAEGLAVSSAISGITKGLASRARPFMTPGEPWHFEFARGWSDAHWFSMPSGHTTAAFGFAVAATLASTRLSLITRAVFATFTIASAIAVAFARTYTDQHWLSDVIAGALLGTITGWALVWLHRRLGNSAFDRALLGASPPA